MILAKVIGNVVSTVIAPGYAAKKIFVVQPVDHQGNSKGNSFLAIDAVQSGIGDIVLVIEEGGSARSIINEPNSMTIKAVITGIVDKIVTEYE